MARNTKLPVNIELGASAKAELNVEVKAEIPTDSVGRLVDALTDAIRPFTERRGLRADEIRLQREDVLLRIAQRARERLQLEGTKPAPVSNKTLVPLLEKASLEDLSDNDMIERWSTLLASASKSSEVSPRLVSILSELRSQDAQLLEAIAMGAGREPGQRDENLERKVATLVRQFDGMLETIDSKAISDGMAKLMRLRIRPLDHTIAYLEMTFAGRGLRLGGWSMHNGQGSGQLPLKLPSYEEAVSAQILLSLGLLSHHSFECEAKGISIRGNYYQITMLGLRFLTVCSPQAGAEVTTLQKRHGRYAFEA